jgi:epoxyqueuosine reductase QueG
LDAQCECLSSISQKKGELSPNEKALLIKENTAWGCDVCQLCCPHTQRAIQKNTLFTPIDYFYQNKIDRLSCRQIDEMDEKEFQMRAYSWRKRETIKRNLFILESADEKNSQSAYKGE